MLCGGAGIHYSDDKLLQTRLFSYGDTQRYRLGANYLLLPVNAPRTPYHNNHHDGAMNFTHRTEEVRSILQHLSGFVTAVITRDQEVCFLSCAGDETGPHRSGKGHH